MKADSKDPGEAKTAGLTTREFRTCPNCGTKFSATGERELCPVCVLLGAAGKDSVPAEPPNGVPGSESNRAETEPGSAVRRFEHYEVMLDGDGKPIELGCGAMGDSTS